MLNIFTASMKQSCKKSLKNRDYTRVYAIMSTYKFNKTSNQSLQGSGPEGLSRFKIDPASCNMLQHIATCRKIDPASSKMLQHIAKCRNRMAKRMQHVVPNNVARCCVEMLRAFGQALIHAKLSAKFFETDFTIKVNVKKQRRFDRSMVIFKLNSKNF